MPSFGFVLIALLVLAACGGSASSAAPPSASPAPAPKVITRAHDGKTFTLRRGREVSLRLSGPPWEEPSASSKAVRLSRVDYFQDPGYSEWMIEGVRAGRVVLTSAAGAKRFRVTLVVPPRTG